MAVAIRLKREGNRNRPFYRIVVADSRARRDGRSIEAIGTYDPLQKGVNFKVDLEKAEGWISKGAQPSDTVRSILKKARREAPPAEEAPSPKAPVKEETPPAAKEEAPPAEEEAKPAEEPAATAEPEPATASEGDGEESS